MSSTGPDPIMTVTTDEARVRRAPKLGAFIVVGALLGFLVTLVLTASFPADENVGFIALVGYFSCYGVPAGAAVGAVVAIVIDRTTSRRARTVSVEHTSIEDGPIEGELED